MACGYSTPMFFDTINRFTLLVLHSDHHLTHFRPHPCHTVGIFAKNSKFSYINNHDMWVLYTHVFWHGKSIYTICFTLRPSPDPFMAGGGNMGIFGDSKKNPEIPIPIKGTPKKNKTNFANSRTLRNCWGHKMMENQRV